MVQYILMDQLFGTDGIRGIAGEFPLDDHTVCLIGAAVARQFRENLGRAPKFVTGRDTRESGARLEAAFHSGAESEGAVCESAAVITTPGVAFLTQRFGYDAGIVISASHNPFRDNGIKIFQPSGRKLDEMTERMIEAEVFEATGEEEFMVTQALPSERWSEFRDAYLDHLVKIADGLSLKGRRIVLDCANGAASTLAPELFAGLGAETIDLHCEPTGRNINEDCGSTHIHELRREVASRNADLGIAFDGDADRALFVDENGELIDGDSTLWIIGRQLKQRGDLKNGKVVATVMSNVGLELALSGEGIVLERTSVGDKFVLEELLTGGSEIGGEQSGHVIFPQLSLVGDGMATALLLLKAAESFGGSLAEAAKGFTRYPQTLKKAAVREKIPFENVAEIASLAKQIESEIKAAGSGRLLLRYSGTENVARVMIEGEDQSLIEEQAARLVEVIESVLG